MRFAALGWRWKMLAAATLVLLVELALRRFARKSAFYRRWQAAFEAVGAVWTAILLSLVYVVSVGLVNLFLRASGKDPLDRSLTVEPSFWRAHEPNPLGPARAARHQF
jgi:hypothetical protein